MDEAPKIKSIVWISSSRRDLKSFPAEVKDVMGYALYQAQLGLKAPSAKPLRGFGGASVLEIIQDHESDTYRAVYTVKFSDLVYVLHAFQRNPRKVSLRQSQISISSRDGYGLRSKITKCVRQGEDVTDESKDQSNKDPKIQCV